MDACYDLASGQIQACAELDRLTHVTFPGHIQQGIVGSMRRVLSLISKTHLRLALEPRLADLDHLVDLWQLYRDLAAQLRWTEAASVMRTAIDAA